MDVKSKPDDIRATGPSGESAQSNSPLNPTPKSAKLPKSKKRMIKYIRSAAGIRTKPQNPLFPDNGLSIVERFFHRMPSTSPQVILSYCGRLQLPKGSTYLSFDRVVDVAKLTAAEIFRTSSLLDYEKQTFESYCDTADKIIVPYKFTPRIEGRDDAMYNQILRSELNQKYDIETSNARLWNIHIVGPKEMETGMDIEKSDNAPELMLFWSFHHCICDGLSGFAFIRLFMTKMIPEAFSQVPMDLSTVKVSKIPPPLLDNYINPHFFQLLPGFKV